MFLQVIWVRGRGPVHKVKVEVLHLERLKGRLEALRHTLVPGVIQLSRDPEVLTLDAGIFDALADFGLVFIGKGAAATSVCTE